MGKFFANIYDYFNGRKTLLFLLLAGSLAIMLYFAVKVKFEEDVTSFFPNSKDDAKTLSVFKNLKVKDKIFIIFSNPYNSNNPDRLIEASENYVKKLTASVGQSHIKTITTQVNDSIISTVTNLIYNNLPIFLTTADYTRLDSMRCEVVLKQKMQDNYNNLVSPIGGAIKNIIIKDPLGIGSNMLAGLQAFSQSSNIQIYNGYLFSKDMSTMLVMIDPIYGTGSTGKNDALITAIELIRDNTQQKFTDVSISYFGGPSIGVYNARQIKKDTMITLSIALLIIIAFITLAFRNRWAIFLIIFPVLYGTVFALAIIYFIKGAMSSIAIGAGAAVFGIAISYSIHVLSHRNHTNTIRNVIEELAYPLTVGSFTTIGAFIGLLFTTSNLLQDFGLFAALTLIGTTFFTLIFLPHLMRNRKEEAPNKLLKWIEKINSYAFDRNYWLVGGLALLTVVCLFTYNDVRFDSDMMHLSVEPNHIKQAEQKLNKVFNFNNNTVLLVSADKNIDSAVTQYQKVNLELSLLQQKGKVESLVSARQFLIPTAKQQQKIEQWNSFWTPQIKEQISKLITEQTAELGFANGSFNPFIGTLSKKYKPLSLTDSLLINLPLLKDMVMYADSMYMLITKITINNKDKEYVYNHISSNTNAIIIDRGYFSNKMAIVVNHDFYLILYISSFLIFFALLLSYGRIELAALAFVPMAISWIIILGLMALFGIEFNIVNIILSTFIFGIGDDFSIFIMDGLLSEYTTGKKLLSSHKTAIFFSAFTTIIGMGALVFAGHPALKSISVISILGMCAVVIISYTIQPILFRLLISSQVHRGGFPYTLLGILNSLYAFLYFLSGCIILQILILILSFLPINKKRKKDVFHSSVSCIAKVFLRTMFTVKVKNINDENENFKKPAVIISNHQSFIDILMLLSLNSKSVMVTNGWVWRSPFFGRIVRYGDFFHTANGYEMLAQTLKDKVAEGYSVIIFPEGTRSADCIIKRFHKGAFYLADILNLDIIPIVQFGNGLISSKRQPFFIKKGIIVSKILPRIDCNSTIYGSTYKEKSKNIALYFREQYDVLCKDYGIPSNPYYYDALIKSYTYKGPILEWYMRIKIRMEENYKIFNNLVPRQATITDIGCGYGPLVFMLSLLSYKRNILGIDYDNEKIDVANNSFLKSPNLNFVAANVLEYNLPASDVFIMNDMLHYMGYKEQQVLIERCISMLNVGGIIIIRDGDNSQTKRHKVTKLTEVFSTKVFKFNKTEGNLYFTSAKNILEIAEVNNMKVEQIQNDKTTSNTIFILRHS
ncbi:MAG: 1-acyl-sn-glycerol-3-phosphate acyltransferase [Bacteroidales bacterium]